MVGVTGFEPATSSSRTPVLRFGEERSVVLPLVMVLAYGDRYHRGPQLVMPS
jgi:hypothetical protein